MFHIRRIDHFVLRVVDLEAMLRFYCAARGRLLELLRYAWASPCSAVGLICAVIAVACGGTVRIRSGVVEVSMSRASTGSGHWRFEAITLGHVVLGRDQRALSRSRSHERVHVRQYECWGITFFLAYPLSSLLQLLRGRNPYRFNYFEVQARARCGESRRPGPSLSAGIGRQQT